MKAVVVRTVGAIDQVSVGDLADPLPRAGEVVVALETSDVNYADLLYVEGRYQRAPKTPFAPGLAGAGRIVAAGEGVVDRHVGERVIVFPEHGTYAEYVCAPSAWCFPLPDAMPCEVAAAIGLCYQTAWFALVERCGFVPGQSVLVLGASGGVGLAAVQLARALGAGVVIAATRGGGASRLAGEDGPDVTIDSATRGLRDQVASEVRAATGGRGADIVIDPVGGATGSAALRALAWGGRQCVVGFASGEIQNVPANYLLVKNIAVLGLQWTDYRARCIDKVRDAQQQIFTLWSQGRINPVPARSLPLERFAQALEALRAGTAGGKWVLATGKARDE